MGGPGEIQLYSSSPEAAHEASQVAINSIRRIEALWSRYTTDSIISRINLRAGGEPVSVDQETMGVLNYAAQCYQVSNGLFDITSGVSKRVWSFKGEPTLPKQPLIDQILELIDWSRVEWKPPFIRLPKPGMEIDLGGLGKEYAVDQAAKALLDGQVTSGFVNLAGDVFVLGPRPDGAPWMIGIVHPREPNQVAASVPIMQGALATSGDYERYWIINGKRYCHIINPKTGWPVDSYQSASVYAPSCLLAGTAATMTMLESDEAGIDLLESLKLKYLVINKDGSLLSNCS